MSPEAQIEALHQLLKTEPRYFLIKRGLYYRPNAAGYTDQTRDAGRYTKAERDLHTSNGRSNEVGSQLVPLSQFSTFEEVIDAEAKLITPTLEQRWGEQLHRITGEAGMAFVGVIQNAGQERCTRTAAMVARLTPAQRREVLVRTFALWTE